MGIDIYTDGSCDTRHRIGGWASMIFVNGEKIILKGMLLDTTHQRMELTAVIESLNYLVVNKLDKNTVNIYSDSQYVVTLANRKERMRTSDFLTKKNQPVRNEDLVRKIFDLLEKVSLNFVKVKSHQKINGEQNINRDVDKLARQIVRQKVSLLIE